MFWHCKAAGPESEYLNTFLNPKKSHTILHQQWQMDDARIGCMPAMAFRKKHYRSCAESE
jgi:hypothetical protein